MRVRPTGLAITAIAALLGLDPARASAGDGGVCIAESHGDFGAVAEAARRAVGVPALRLDLSDRAERAALSTRCDRLIIAVGPTAPRAAAELAPSTPMVHVLAGAGEARGRAGVSADPEPRRVLETLQAMDPGVRRVGAVFDPGQTGELVAEAQAAARALGLELVALPAPTVGEAVRAFHRFETDVRVDALWLLPDGTVTVQETVYYALELAHWRRMAVVGLSRWYVASGALFALVPRPASLGAAAGELGRQLLRGDQPPATVRARDFSLYVNQRTASQLGLRLPRHLLDAAAEVLP